MHRISLHYALGTAAASALIRNPLLDLLQAVSAQGSISAAARVLGLSYRHVWGELKRWEGELGQPLILWEKGQAARLSEFGAKLLLAERQVQARLLPQIEALRADLERAFAIAFDDAVHVLSFHASHDEALAALGDEARAGGLHLDVRFTGSVDAIRALNEGRCTLAGFHVRLPAVPGSRLSSSHSQRSYKPLLRPGLHKLIGFARRSQGLIVARGNPLRLRGLFDLARPGVRFVNRARGTGTRVVLDELLGELGVAPSAIPGYAADEPSHAAVAQAVATGQADAGFGIEASARSRGLDFVPLVEEAYFLACLKSTLEQPATRALLAVLRTAQWQQRLAQLPGYAPMQSGEVLSMSRVLPWWRFGGRGGEGGSARKLEQ
ncbi:substrate-binding domain-containing protein [Thauera sp.]|jgi:putative molybdopterin biosynthesis protein|uniref:substrate-binding domain-containing protein n=1 Tax=Thauera sp. TaxID=1905334 RepID=UPI002A36ABC0|nr:substrate-binding domain-containing protein [Thauera sp.]MDX9886168.1 substrate-binding domain-containing protein [Thauera sp.]